MNIIDDKGRLFGTVNIIDALVVLLVLAVVAAGTAFVLQFDDSPSEANATVENATRYATLDLGTQPSYTAERITEGDNTTDANLTVTDVYRIPTEDGVHVWTRVQLDGQLVERENTSEFAFADSSVKPGTNLAFETGEYAVNGTVHDLAKHNPSLPGGSENVVLRTAVTAEKAAAIEAGDTYAVANETVATVESVDVYPTNNQNRKLVVLGATLDTLRANGQQQFLGRPVHVGQALSFQSDAYAIETEVVHRGDLAPPGDRTTTTVTVELTNVTPTVADGIATGMTEQGSDGVRARITDKQIENATVVVESRDGNIYEREHPKKKDVTLTVELDTRQTEAGLYFHGRQLQEGNDLVLDLGSITVHGQVTDLQQDDE